MRRLGVAPTPREGRGSSSQRLASITRDLEKLADQLDAHALKPGQRLRVVKEGGDDA